MKIYCIANKDWKGSDGRSQKKYFSTVDGTTGYFRDKIKHGFVEELTVTSPMIF